MFKLILMVPMFLERWGWCQKCWTLLKSCDAAQTLDEPDIEEIMNVDSNTQVIHALTDEEIMEMVLHSEDKGKSDYDSGNNGDHWVKKEKIEKKVSIDEFISLCKHLINGLEQRSFKTEQQIMSVFKIQKHLIQAL